MHLYAIIGDHIPKEYDPWNKELTFFKLAKELLISKNGKDLLQMLDVVLLNLAIYKYIIKVYNHK